MIRVGRFWVRRKNGQVQVWHDRRGWFFTAGFSLTQHSRDVAWRDENGRPLVTKQLPRKPLLTDGERDYTPDELRQKHGYPPYWRTRPERWRL